jgi:uncharacterized phage protein (TIGR01671 family)
MNREILFRGKTLDNGDWVYGWYFQKPNPFTTDGLPITHAISDLPPFGNIVASETVGQFTGLLDKNGKKIFEGDILKCKTIDGYYANFVVAWSDFRKYIIGCNSEESYDIAPSKFKEAEIIGNIHDTEVQP